MPGMKKTGVLLAGALAVVLIPGMAFPEQDHEPPVSTPEDVARMDAFMDRVGLTLPAMDPVRGRDLFLQKGCVVCHAVNGIGGEDAPPLDAEYMEFPMNPFEFAAKMWRGAPAMTILQEDELGEFVTLNGQELADLIAFFHDADEQAKLTKDQIPEKYEEMLHAE